MSAPDLAAAAAIAQGPFYLIRPVPRGLEAVCDLDPGSLPRSPGLVECLLECGPGEGRAFDADWEAADPL